MVKQPGSPIDPKYYSAQTAPSNINLDGLVVERAASREFPEISMHASGKTSSFVAQQEIFIEVISEGTDEAEELHESVDRIKFLNHLGSILSDAPPPTFSEWIKNNREAIVQDILFNQGHAFTKKTKELGEFENHKEIKELALAGLLDHEEKGLTAEEIFQRFIYILPETSGKNFLFYKRVLNDEVASYVKELQHAYRKTWDPDIKDRIDTLNHWLKKQHIDLKSSYLTKIEGGIEATGAALKIPFLVAVRALDLLRFLDAAFSMVSLGVSNFFKVGFSVFELARTIRHKKIHANWQEKYRSRRGVLEKTNNRLLSKTGEAIDTLLKRRKLEEERRMASVRPEIQALLQQLNHADTLEQAQALFKEKGLRVEDIQENPTIEGLKESLQQTEMVERLIMLLARHYEAVQMSARHALISSDEIKAFNLKKKFSFDLKLNTANLFLTSLTVIVAVVLNVLIFTSIITVPQFFLPILAAGLFVATLVVGIVGLFYFYRKSPHRFKEFIKGVNFRLGAYGIPGAYRNFFLKRKQQKQRDELATSYQLRVQMRQIEHILQQLSLNPQALPKKLHILAISMTPPVISSEETIRYQRELERLQKLYQNKLKNNERRREKRAEKINQLERKVEFWNFKKEPLLEKLKRAAVADYLRAAQLSRNVQGEPIELSKMIVEGLFSNPELLDAETINILDRRFDIDVKKLQAEENPEIKETVQKQLDTFFAMNEKKFINFIRRKIQEIKDEDQTIPVYP